MLAQRAAQQSLRRLAATTHPLRFTTPFAVATGNALRTQQHRLAATTTVSNEHANTEILARQRLARPVAPHLAIYAAQIPWYLSGLNRITGCTLSGAFYIFGSLYLVAPYIGLHMESATMAAAFATWPVVVKVGLKMLAAFPFTFHCLNGLRHLTWDTTYMITNQKVIQTGWAVVGLSVVSAAALAFM